MEFTYDVDAELDNILTGKKSEQQTKATPQSAMGNSAAPQAYMGNSTAPQAIQPKMQQAAPVAFKQSEPAFQVP